MHEIGVVRAMVKTVTDYAAANQISEISEIVADCGELSLVIPEYVEELYPPVVKGTPLENTKLIVNIVPGMAECEDCDEIFNVIECNGYCPNCNSFNKTEVDAILKEHGAEHHFFVLKGKGTNCWSMSEFSKQVGTHEAPKVETQDLY